jgi:drug/metabolite transporter (DMT)-like permease
MLLVLSALWGASYLFIKIAVDDIEPTTMMAARAFVAGVLLLGYVMVAMGARRALAHLRRAWRQALFLGAFNAALPFFLIAWGEKYIDSGVAAVAQSTVPLFSFVIGLRFLPHERVAAIRWLGVALGIVGVAVLAGLDPGGGWWAVAGTMAIVLSSVSYAASGIYGQLRAHGTPGPILAAGSMLVGGLLLMPLGIAQAPNAVPGWESIASVAAMTILGTFFAQLVFFRMLPLYGARRISMVAYVIPVMAIVYGALFLSEPLTRGMLVGVALILPGVALGSGLARWRRARIVEDPA